MQSPLDAPLSLPWEVGLWLSDPHIFHQHCHLAPNQPWNWTRVCVFIAQSCLTLCNPGDYSPPCSSVHGVSQARILEWVATPFSRGSSQSRDQILVSCVSCTGKRILYHRATKELWPPGLECLPNASPSPQSEVITQESVLLHFMLRNIMKPVPLNSFDWWLWATGTAELKNEFHWSLTYLWQGSPKK